MIKIQESVPSIYYNSSRDFQLIGHLFDLVLNAVKTDADLVFNLPFSTNSDDQLLDLMTYTFGLKLDKNRYTSKQLRNICSVAPQMMRSKGSMRAVQLLCTALMHAEGLEDLFALDVSADGSELIISLSANASCKEILQEILPYILPAGMVFNIVKSARLESTALTTTGVHDTVQFAIKEPSAVIVKPDPKGTNPTIKNNADVGIFTFNSTTTADTYINDAANMAIMLPNLTNKKGDTTDGNK